MSTNNGDADEVCASCGIAGGDNINLQKCSACKIVQYCGVACQREHRPQHKRTCRARAAELREETLFKQPENNHIGDCPICFLPLPLDHSKSNMQTCCSKIICDGCLHANFLREEEGSFDQKCLFCRRPRPATRAEADQNTLRRMEANDPVAIRSMGVKCYMERDYGSAFKHWTNAAGLGDVEAHYQLAVLYMDGQGVSRNKKKENYHWEEAAIGGHPGARYNLGVNEGRNGNIGRAVKHHIIAANAGHSGAMEKLVEGFRMGFVKKEDLDAALRAHQAAVDATKSPQREAAEEAEQIQNNFIPVEDM